MGAIKELKDMSPEELHKEVYRLRHKATELKKTVDRQAAVIAYLKENDLKKIVEAVRNALPTRSIRRL